MLRGLLLPEKQVRADTGGPQEQDRAGADPLLAEHRRLQIALALRGGAGSLLLASPEVEHRARRARDRVPHVADARVSGSTDEVIAGVRHWWISLLPGEQHGAHQEAAA